jgi:3-deoxy-D-manno-octulosonic-acid transferase
MVLFFYNLALLTALVAGGPWWLWKTASTEKYREGLRARLGRVPAWLASMCRQKPVIWLHAVSVGEVLAVSRLVSELDKRFSGFQVLISTTTRTGQKLAQERFGANRVFYSPLDVPWAVRAYLKAVGPRMVILAETEFWPNLLNGCFKRQIPVAVVNARISDRSWPRYRTFRRFWRPLLARLSRILAQSEVDAGRLTALGCLTERVSVSGNLKFDVRATKEAEATRQLRSLGAGLRFVVAGSTLEGEEAALLDAWPQLLEAEPRLVMVLAPRHPERFGAVAGLLEQSGIRWSRRSEWKGRAQAELESLEAGRIVLLDTIGELASVYSLASVAFVGGSVVPAGGHNPLEPAQFGVPIVMGPHYVNFRAITDDLRSQDGIRIADGDALGQTLGELLRDGAEAKALGENARRVFEQQAGATDRTVRALEGLLAREVRTP